MAYLRMVLLGGRGSGKTSSVNTILRGGVIVPRSVQSVRHGEAAGRRLTVVDSPGWNYRPLQETPEMDKLELQNSVCLCPPGPHAVLLTVPLNRTFKMEHRVALEEHMSLLSQRVWSHTMVLFTFGDLLDRSIEQRIEAGGEHLHWLVAKCGNRYHVFNNEKRDNTQVAQLLEMIDATIEEMVAGNRAGHYEVDADVAVKLSERKRSIEDDVHTLMTRTHRQRTVLKALFEGEHQRLPDVRLMLVGGDQDSRSLAGDVILQSPVFPFMMTECVRHQRRVADRNVSVVMCPDWSTTPPSQKAEDVLLRGANLCSPGPHAVLLNVDVRSSFSEADGRSVEEHMELLGDRVWRHTLVLLTQGWWLGERRVEEYIEAEGEPLRRILEKCGYRYQVLDMSDVKDLMEKVEDMVTRNRGHLGPSEDRSVRDAGHLSEGHETRQTFTAEEWNRREEEFKRREEEWKRREEEMIEKVLQFVEKESEEPNLLPVRRRWSKDLFVPSMSGGSPSEAGSSYRWSPDKVHDWLLKRHAGSIARSSGYGSGVASQLDAMSVRDDDDSDMKSDN